VLYVPELQDNLISQGQIEEKWTLFMTSVFFIRTLILCSVIVQ
jgi:hypothetical protein